eukprot:6433481-Lingulodinium_polyedra.AAC.1
MNEHTNKHTHERANARAHKHTKRAGRERSRALSRLCPGLLRAPTPAPPATVLPRPAGNACLLP